MSELCPVCGTEYPENVKECEVCGFADEKGINRKFPAPQDLQNWLETVVKPYRVQWEAKKARESKPEQPSPTAVPGTDESGSGYTAAPPKKRSVGGCILRAIGIMIVIAVILVIGLIIAAITLSSDSKTAPQPAPNPPKTQPQQLVKTYKIGERGPAGGIVFYDSGNSWGGWRYMEATPSDLKNAKWGATFLGLEAVVVSGTKRNIGSGKRNTELILAELYKKGASGGAAQVCEAYILNGYNDWFLPSKDELNLLYENLKKNKKGKFSGGWYWSSSQNDAKDAYAWAQKFSDGSQDDLGKPRTNLVRAVRVFK